MIKKKFKTIYYIGGTLYRGMIGVYHNTFDKELEIPKEVEKFVIGKSIQGKEILGYKLGQGDQKFLIVGGIHGNEVGTVKLAKKTINYFFVNKPNVQLFVIPSLNIDGHIKAIKNRDYVHRGKTGRFNSNKGDLNRNFSSKNWGKESVWGIGKSYSEEMKPVYCGEHPGSEPEIQGLISFIGKEQIKNLIMLHNVGSNVVCTADDDIANKWADIYEQNTNFKKIHRVSNITGSAMDWSKENNVHYLGIEGSSRWGSDWKKQKKAIIKMLNI